MQLFSEYAPFKECQIYTCAQIKAAGNHQAMGIEVLMGLSLLQRQINSILLIVVVFNNVLCKLQLQTSFYNTLEYQNF